MQNKLAICFFLLFFLVGCNIDVSVTKGGTVVSNPALINCRATTGKCKVKNYENIDIDIEDLIVTFRAIPDDGYVLSHWQGHDCRARIANKCRAKLKGNIKLKAFFEPIEYSKQLPPNHRAINFIAMGDTGTGLEGQYRVAKAIETWCTTKSCDFVIGAGDNFYDGTPDNIHDKQFETKFELPYKNLSMPFYMVLGNHDTGRFRDGDGGNQKLGEVQVAYHHREDKMSNKWQMPSRYYHVKFPHNATTPLLELFALDSAPFVGLPEGSKKYEPYDYKRRQGAWFQEKIIASKAYWKIAFTHHPYVSNGKHGNASNYDSSLSTGGIISEKASGQIFRDFMEDYVCNKVDLLVTGHDHNLQILKPVAPCGLTEFVVSGAGSKSNGIERINDNQVYFQQGDHEGFFYVTVDGNKLILEAVSALTESPKPLFIQSYRKKQL